MKIGKRLIFFFIILNCFLAAQDDIPYPQNTQFDSINWHWNTYKYAADGSDLWPATWAYDDNIYTSWGDGGGFGGNNQLGRVSLGFGKIEGHPDNYNGINVWGGYNSAHPSTFNGKCNAIICVDSILYALINTQSPKFPESPDFKLAWSTNLGATWNLTDWVFAGKDSLLPGSFINFGKNNQGCRDEYIYITCGKWIPTGEHNIHSYLMRVHKNDIKEKNKYEFYSGYDNLGNPNWSVDVKYSIPIFTDQNGADGIEIIYNQSLKSYILASGHYSIDGKFRSIVAGLGIFIAPEPWGPWTTVAYYNNWGNFKDIEENLGYHIPLKWISEDGKTFWVFFSSGSYLDRFNMVSGTFVESKQDSSGEKQDTTSPAIPQNLNLIERGEHQASFSWMPSNDPESGIKTYKIYRDHTFLTESDSIFFKDSYLTDNTSYIYNISALNSIGLESQKSNPLIINTLADTIPPQIINVYFQNDSTKLYLQFSEIIDESSAENIDNYQISNEIEINYAVLDSTGTIVKLSSAAHKRFFSYWITATNIYDKASSPNLVKQNRTNYFYPTYSLIDNLAVNSILSYELIRSYNEYETVYIDNNIKIENNEFPEIIGNPFIRTAFSDRHISRDDFLTFDLNLSADIYVLHDNRIKNKPGWLSGFYNTGIKTIIGDSYFTFYQKYFNAEKVTLGGNVNDGDLRECGMYVVIIKPSNGTNVKHEVPFEKGFRLYQNYPNPFNPSTFIKYSIPRAGSVIIRIYNSLGENIAVLQDEKSQGGIYKLEWNSTDSNKMSLASGVYFYELIFQGEEHYKAVNKMILIK